MRQNKNIKVLISSVIFSALFAILFKWWTTGNPFHMSTIIFGAIILAQLLVSFYIGKKFFAYFMAKPSTQIRKLIVPYFILFLIFILLVCLVIIGLSLYISNLVMGVDTSGFIDKLFQVEYPAAIKYYFFFALLASSFFFYKIWRQASDKEQLLREENLKYQYRTLKAQVNPHFLFNSLNTLSEIIYEDARKADDYIQKLSGIYRYILDNENVDLISLDKELEFVIKYFELQKERDGNKIELKIQVGDAEKLRIVPVSLQILVENALKHNSVSENNRLKITVYKEDTFIVVSNNIQRKNTLDNSCGTGLTNLKERVKLITGKKAVINEDNHKFIVKIPIITITE